MRSCFAEENGDPLPDKEDGTFVSKKTVKATKGVETESVTFHGVPSGVDCYVRVRAIAQAQQDPNRPETAVQIESAWSPLSALLEPALRPPENLQATAESQNEPQGEMGASKAYKGHCASKD